MSDIKFEQRIFNSGVPQWVKITKLYSDFATGALTNTINIYSLPLKGMVHSVMIIPTTVFNGGLIASYTLSVGVSGTPTKYAIATNVFTGSTLPVPSVVAGVESTSGAVNITTTAISTVGNLSAATQGSVDIYLLISQLT